jgi:hypothetical protein
MRSPILTLSWQEWWRYRWLLAACAAVWVILAALGLLLPRGMWAPAAPGADPLTPVATVVLGLSIPAFGIMFSAFSAIPYAADSDIAARETGFPTRTFTLPASTALLVAVPMLQATVATAVVWVAWAGAVLRPAGMDAPLLWPALVAAALVAWLQALIWQPYPLRFLRIVVATVVLTVIGLAPAFLLAAEAPPAVIAAVLAALIPPAYGVAVVGVARARRGDVPTWTWPSRLAATLASRPSRRLAPFASALQAQSWLEWRMRGASLPFMVGLVAVVWALTFVTGAGENSINMIASVDDTHFYAAAVDALTAPGVLLAWLAAVVPFMAGVAGAEVGGMGSLGFRLAGGPIGCHPFLALRPVTDVEFIVAKLRMAVRSTLTSWAIALAAAFLCLGLTGKWRDLAGSQLLQTHGALEVCGGLAAGLAGLMVLTWLRLVVNLWLGLTGRRWLGHVFGAVVVGAFVALGLLVHWVSGRPERLAALRAALPYVAAGAVVLKLLLAGWLTRALLRRGLVRFRTLALAAVAWASAAVGTVALLRLLTPNGPSWPVLVLGVMLVLPLNRFAAPPLALEWNRHR